MSRWHKKEYQEIEREFAKQWRQTLDILSFDTAIGIVKNILPTDQRFTTLEQIKSFIDGFASGSSKELLILALDFLGIPDVSRKAILNRWETEHRPALDKFAPYATYVFKIDLLFYIGALRGLIAKERPTNKVDLAYLYYLPFCHVFVSGDKLHARTAPLFMRKDQTFISASDFKDGLAKINKHYLQFKDKIAEVGVMQFAHYPPIEVETSIHKLWDLHCPSWRKSASNILKHTGPSPKSAKSAKSLLEHLKRVQKESVPIDPNTIQDMDEADYIIESHMMAVQKGIWRILPKGIENRKEED